MILSHHNPEIVGYIEALIAFLFGIIHANQRYEWSLQKVVKEFVKFGVYVIALSLGLGIIYVFMRGSLYYLLFSLSPIFFYSMFVFQALLWRRLLKYVRSP